MLVAKVQMRKDKLEKTPSLRTFGLERLIGITKPDFSSIRLCEMIPGQVSNQIL